MREGDALVGIPFKAGVDGAGCDDAKAFWLAHGQLAEQVDTRGELLLDVFRAIISFKDQEGGLELHVDYSSMPRSWYCRLLEIAIKLGLEAKSIFVWYAPGNYHGVDYPIRSLDTFRLFSGQGRLDRSGKLVILGLGFERVRAETILEALDPDYVELFAAVPGANIEADEKVLRDNGDLIDQYPLHRIPLSSFSLSLGLLRQAVEWRRAETDVILVPDGPKPLIFACSLIPGLIAEPGVTCLHVASAPPTGRTATIVEAVGKVYGARLSWSKSSAKHEA
jgi:hypothetical protein